ncbi:MAG TPA: NAD-dependent epimerase/dehydratase family protein [Anaerolineales bacterium]|nr:NAD-dependent epimerase/dehydratase family protein [Anaerolineales bacterium]
MNHTPTTNFTRNVLVVGATGFIGGHIAQSALDIGWKVRALRRNPASTGHLNNAPVEWITGDLNSPESLIEAMRGVDIVFHAAGYYPNRKERHIVDAQVDYALGQIRNVINAAKRTGIRLLIYTSTLTTIGNPPQSASRLANEEDFYIPGSMAKNAYYEAKFAMEQELLQAAKESLAAIVLNPTAVLGPGEVHVSVGGLLLAMAHGWGIAWLPVIVNIVDVRDVAQAHIQAAIRGKIGERYIIGGHNIELREAMNQVAAVAHVQAPRFGIPLWFVEGLIRLDDALPFINLTGDHLRAIRLWQGYDTTKARLELGLNPRPLEVTFQDSLDWFNKQGLLP